MKEKIYLTYQELKETPIYKDFNESFVKRNYKSLMDTFDMQYSHNESVLLWVDKYRVDVTELYGQEDKKEMKYHQKYLDDIREERRKKKEEVNKEEKKQVEIENDCKQQMLNCSNLVKSAVKVTTWDIKIEDKDMLFTYCHEKGVHTLDNFIDGFIVEKTYLNIDRQNEEVTSKWYVRYMDGRKELYDKNNSYHKKINKYISRNI
jgi:seryl-tRNA synthetase